MMPESEITNGHGSNIETLAPAFVAALLKTGRLADAGREVGISVATAKRWFCRPQIRQAFREAQCAVVEEAVGELASSASLATGTLVGVCTDPDAPPATRVAAARAILEFALKRH